MGNATVVMSLGGDYDTTRAVLLESAIERIEGVESVVFNYTNNKLTVKFGPDQATLKEIQGLVARERKHHVRTAAREE
jgi:copper chaperone CopZ